MSGGNSIIVRVAWAAVLMGGVGCAEENAPDMAPDMGTAGSPITGTSGAAGTLPMTGGRGGAAGMVVTPPPSAGTGTGGAAGTVVGMAGMTGMAGMPGGEAGAGTAGEDGEAGEGEAGMGGMASAGEGGSTGAGMCCSDGDCLCHGDVPSALTSDRGPYDTDSYTISGVGCVHYPTDAEPPFAAVAISDGFLGSGGCSSFQTGQWGPLYASWGIVAMIVNTGSSDQPATRGRALSEGIAAFKEENGDSGSPLFEKLAGRYGTSGFSMGGGGTTYAARDDDTLLTSVAIMPWGPTSGSGVTVPHLVICGASDGTASCTSHGTPFYRSVAESVPKMRVTVSGGHNGQPSAGGGESGEFGLAFQKVFLEGDERWRPLLIAGDADDSTIQ
jgi:hypothetical protein